MKNKYSPRQLLDASILTGNLTRKQGHNPAPSQVVERPPPPASFYYRGARVRARPNGAAT